MAEVEFRSRIAAGNRMVGTFSLIPSVEIIELLSIASASARAANMPLIVRDASPGAIGAVLDPDCDGVLVPR